jgi:hypothetical protein
MIQNFLKEKPSRLAPPFLKALFQEQEANFPARMISRLEIVKEIGRGTYGTVFWVRFQGRDYALKQIRKPLGNSLAYLWG